jgi:hypothetical protein
LNERLAEIDRELSSFEVSEQRLEAAIAQARALRSELGALEALDATLDALGEGLVVSMPGARATTWEDARRAALSEMPSEGSGLLDVSDEALLRSGELPAVLSIAPAHDDEEREPISAATAAYIDPPSLPPRPPTSQVPVSEPLGEDFSLDLDPEAGLVEPGAAPLSYVPAAKPSRAPSAPRPSSAPSASTEDMLAEILDVAEPVEPPPPPPLPEPPPSVAEDETSDALAAMQAEMPSSALDREASDAFEASLSDPAFDVGSIAIGDEEEVERTVMMKGSALLPPAPGGVDALDPEYADGVPSAEFELDFDDEIIEIEEEVPEASDRSRPPPPPSRPPETSRSRPPEPPGQGFLSRLLKGNKS